MSAVGSTDTTSKAPFTQVQGKGIESMKQDEFLKLIITELRNQDPLAPTDNAAVLEQVGQLRSIAANDSLMSTLGSFSVTQELTTASNLIGKKIDGLDIEGKAVNGSVSSVSVKIDENDRNNRQIRLHVGAQTVDIKNIREIVPAE